MCCYEYKPVSRECRGAMGKFYVKDKLLGKIFPLFCTGEFHMTILSNGINWEIFAHQNKKRTTVLFSVYRCVKQFALNPN